MHPSDELEQRFLRFTTTVKELIESVMVAVDDDKVPAEVVDNVSNLAVGLKQYVVTCEEEIANAISHDYGSNPLQQTTGILVIGDDYTVQLPRYILDLLGWGAGDTLKWEIRDETTTIITKVD